MWCCTKYSFTCSKCHDWVWMINMYTSLDAVFLILRYSFTSMEVDKFFKHYDSNHDFRVSDKEMESNSFDKEIREVYKHLRWKVQHILHYLNITLTNIFLPVVFSGGWYKSWQFSWQGWNPQWGVSYIWWQAVSMTECTIYELLYGIKKEKYYILNYMKTQKWF